VMLYVWFIAIAFSSSSWVNVSLESESVIPMRQDVKKISNLLKQYAKLKTWFDGF